MENLYFANADGTGLAQLTHAGGKAGAFSSRGLVAYVSRGYVRLVRSDGTHGRRLARGDKPDFSPSGATVVFEHKKGLYRRSIKPGAKRHRVARRGSDPVFSPTGKRVLYVKLGIGLDALYTVTPKGKRRKRLFRSVDLSSAGQSGLSDPAWQPRR